MRSPLFCAPAAGDVPLLAGIEQHADEFTLIEQVLAELQTILHPYGAQTPEEAAGGDVIAIGKNSGLGKQFANGSVPFGLPTARLFRSQAMERERSFGQQRRGSMHRHSHRRRTATGPRRGGGFLLGYALTLAQPGRCVAFSLAPGEARDQLLPALWHALDFNQEGGPEVKAQSARIREIAEASKLEEWRALLGPLQEANAAALGELWLAYVERVGVPSRHSRGALTSARHSAFFHAYGRRSIGLASPHG